MSEEIYTNGKDVVVFCRIGQSVIVEMAGKRKYVQPYEAAKVKSQLVKLGLNCISRKEKR